jgi:hypothetical protein
MMIVISDGNFAVVGPISESFHDVLLAPDELFDSMYEFDGDTVQ